MTATGLAPQVDFADFYKAVVMIALIVLAATVLCMVAARAHRHVVPAWYMVRDTIAAVPARLARILPVAWIRTKVALRRHRKANRDAFGPWMCLQWPDRDGAPLTTAEADVIEALERFFKEPEEQR